MKAYILYIIGLLSFSLSALAQKDTIQVNYPYQMIGYERRIDYNVPSEFAYKYLNRSVRSFGLKVSKYDYGSRIPGISFNTTIPSIGIRHQYAIEGVSLKAGWIFWNVVKKREIGNQGIYLVSSRNRHTYKQFFSDAGGIRVDAYESIHYAFGIEYEFMRAAKIFDNFFIVVTVHTGLKPTGVKLFNKVINGLPAYYRYAPAQGFGLSPIYVNASLGLSFMF